MKPYTWLDKSLSILGNFLVWVPLLLPFVFGLFMLQRSGMFRVDYLMPAELFPATLLGCLLLYFIDRRIKTHQKYIGWTFLAAVILFFGTQGLAVVTGAANAEADAVRWYWVLMVGIILFDLALILVGVGGILQLKQLFRPAILPSPTKDPV